MKRKILVILSNRWNRSQKARFLELDADDKGNILKERPLRGPPGEPKYHEVWENDEGKTSLASCYRIKRKYGHALERPRGGRAAASPRRTGVRRASKTNPRP
jgi:hypothetical protein